VAHLDAYPHDWSDDPLNTDVEKDGHKSSRTHASRFLSSAKSNAHNNEGNNTEGKYATQFARYRTMSHTAQPETTDDADDYDDDDEPNLTIGQTTGMSGDEEPGHRENGGDDAFGVTDKTDAMVRVFGRSLWFHHQSRASRNSQKQL